MYTKVVDVWHKALLDWWTLRQGESEVGPETELHNVELNNVEVRSLDRNRVPPPRRNTARGRRPLPFPRTFSVCVPRCATLTLVHVLHCYYYLLLDGEQKSEAQFQLLEAMQFFADPSSTDTIQEGVCCASLGILCSFNVEQVELSKVSPSFWDPCPCVCY